MEWVRGSFLRGGLCVMDEGGLSEMGEEEIFEGGQGFFQGGAGGSICPP